MAVDSAPSPLGKLLPLKFSAPSQAIGGTAEGGYIRGGNFSAFKVGGDRFPTKLIFILGAIGLFVWYKKK